MLENKIKAVRSVFNEGEKLLSKFCLDKSLNQLYNPRIVAKLLII